MVPGTVMVKLPGTLIDEFYCLPSHCLILLLHYQKASGRFWQMLSFDVSFSVISVDYWSLCLLFLAQKHLYDSQERAVKK